MKAASKSISNPWMLHFFFGMASFMDSILFKFYPFLSISIRMLILKKNVSPEAHSFSAQVKDQFEGFQEPVKYPMWKYGREILHPKLMMKACEVNHQTGCAVYVMSLFGCFFEWASYVLSVLGTKILPSVVRSIS